MGVNTEKATARINPIKAISDKKKQAK